MLLHPPGRKTSYEDVTQGYMIIGTHGEELKPSACSQDPYVSNVGLLPWKSNLWFRKVLR